MELTREELERIVQDPTSNPSEREAAQRMLSGEGSSGPLLGADLFYRRFLSSDEIRTVYAAALDESRRIYYDLLGGPADPRLAPFWCDTAQVLHVGCSNLRKGELDPETLCLRPDIVDRIENHWDELSQWETERWQTVRESVGLA